MDEREFVDSNGIVHRCCVCKKYKILQTGEYHSLKDLQKPPDEFVSDGYCPSCSEQAMAELRAYHAEKDQIK